MKKFRFYVHTKEEFDEAVKKISLIKHVRINLYENMRIKKNNGVKCDLIETEKLQNMNKEIAEMNRAIREYHSRCKDDMQAALFPVVTGQSTEDINNGLRQNN